MAHRTRPAPNRAGEQSDHERPTSRPQGYRPYDQDNDPDTEDLEPEQITAQAGRDMELAHPVNWPA